jgi:protein O-GlcNAc transferase
MSSNVLLMNKARASHAQGDLAAAAMAYESILKLDPRNYEAAYLLAVAFYQAGRLERAAAGFAVAARLNPRKVEPHKDRGLVLMKLAQYEEALKSFETATRLMPGSPELLLNRGLAQKNTGRIAESIESYEAALRLKPRFAEAHNNLANSLSLLGRKEEALASYTRAFTLKPGYGEAHVNAAALLQELDRFQEAKAILDQAIAANPRHAEAHRSLAECLHQMDRIDEALASASRALQIDKASVEAYLTRAGILKTAAREADALNDYSSALALEPRNMEALLAKAHLLCNQKRYDEAVALCDLAISADPAEARAYHRIGQAFEGRREYPAAIVSYEKAAELDPDWLSPLLRRASALGEIGRQEEALAAYDQAIAAHPDSAEAQVGKGDFLRNLRRFEEALPCYDRAMSLAPGRPSYHGLRGSLLAELGRADAALDDFRQELNIIAAGKPAAEAMAGDCIKLLSIDKIPAIYPSESDLAQTRDRVEAVLDRLLETYDVQAPLSAEQTRVSEQAVRHLTGFYLAYHQRNDRETMRKLSRVATRLLSLAPQEVPSRASQRGKIRVGIASQRLRDHNGANWAYNWFARLPRGDYEIFTYSFETKQDALAEKFAQLGTHRQLSWSRATPHEIVAQMRSDDLDVLMLTDVGMTPVSRFLSLHRIAPCQFTAWGHPVTTGSAEMDYYVSSDLMEPTDAQDHYTEKLIRMPNLALYLEEEDDTAKGTGAGFGLPEGRVLYGCLQSLFKYLPRHDDILPRIALEVPAALFVFLEGSPPYMTVVMKERLQGAFAAHGLDAARHVTFLPRQKPADFDRLMRAMDICIDSVGWSGGNTSLKNIALGVPLATLQGDFMRGRHSSAMFRMIGAQEMIAETLDGYVQKLVTLGQQEAYRRHCADLFSQGQHRLYRDQTFIDAFDGFLKSVSTD